MPKTIVITGTAAGMGRATVGKFAAEGWNVVATVRKESDLESHTALRCVKTLLLDVDDEGASVPFAQRAVLGHPSDLWKALMGKPGTTPVDMEV